MNRISNVIINRLLVTQNSARQLLPIVVYGAVMCTSGLDPKINRKVKTTSNTHYVEVLIVFWLYTFKCTGFGVC